MPSTGTPDSRAAASWPRPSAQAARSTLLLLLAITTVLWKQLLCRASQREPKLPATPLARPSLPRKGCPWDTHPRGFPKHRLRGQVPGLLCPAAATWRCSSSRVQREATNYVGSRQGGSKPPKATKGETFPQKGPSLPAAPPWPTGIRACHSPHQTKSCTICATTLISTPPPIFQPTTLN